MDGYPEFEELGLPAEVPVDDQPASGYIDIGNTRITYGVTAGSSAVETVTFPAGGFSSPPVLTLAPVGTVLREIAINAITTTSATIEAGGTQVKHWQAIGTKP